MNTRLTNILLVFAFSLPVISHADSMEGKWCENGGPYTCYPPIDNKIDTYTCIDSTTIINANDNVVEWVVNQTVHYYSDGFKNGKTKSQQIKRKFIRNQTLDGKVFEHTETSDDQQQLRQLTLSDQNISLIFKQTSNSTDTPVLLSKANYQRCNADTNKKRFYTALVDCGGSGDYIAGVPAVVNNPLLWDLGDSNANNNTCQVAAKCWGGGWVAYAYSNGNENNGKAFGAACGGKSRHDAKQQAINSCRESGGENCFYTVVSGYDNGNRHDNDNTNKGVEVESCRNGNCELRKN